jgi:hypothetical protein
MQRSPVHGGGAASTLASPPPGPASVAVPPDPATPPTPPLPPEVPPLPALPPLDPPAPPEPAFPPVDPPTPAPPPVAPAVPLAPPFPLDVPPPPLPVLDPPVWPDPPPPVDRIPSDSLPHPIATSERAIQHRRTNAELNRQSISSPREPQLRRRTIQRLYSAPLLFDQPLINMPARKYANTKMLAYRQTQSAQFAHVSNRAHVAPACTRSTRAQTLAPREPCKAGGGTLRRAATPEQGRAAPAPSAP